jgi:hypothetical protein
MDPGPKTSTQNVRHSNHGPCMLGLPQVTRGPDTPEGHVQHWPSAARAALIEGIADLVCCKALFGSAPRRPRTTTSP